MRLIFEIQVRENDGHGGPKFRATILRNEQRRVVEFEDLENLMWACATLMKRRLEEEQEVAHAQS